MGCKLIGFEKVKSAKGQYPVLEKWDKIDSDAAARGAAILMNGSADFGKLNCSFTAEKDVEEFEKQVFVHDEFFRKLESDPAYKDAATKISEMLDELEKSDFSDF